MDPLNATERCLSFINSQLLSGGRPAVSGEPRGVRAITISRQTGSGGHTIAEKLAEHLSCRDGSRGGSWTIFDRNLVEKVLEDHKLPARLARFMPEDRVSEIDDIMDELFGLHPSSWLLVRKTSETILHLAELGNVIVIGRAANIVTARLAHAFHVRLVGVRNKRIARFAEANSLSYKEASRDVEREDLARQRYVRQFFGKDINDPLLYHLVLNTDLIPAEEAARLIALAAEEPRAVAAAA